MREPVNDLQSPAEDGMNNMRRNEGEKIQGAGRAGAEGRERLIRAAASIQLDSQKYLAQFSGSLPLTQALLPGAPANPLPSDLAGPPLLKALLLDPMYQLK
jgi:hypothetical protein